MKVDMIYDVVIVGGGPAGLSAALALGRGRKYVLVCDTGSRRNAAATHIHNFVTRDGVPPEEFRRAAHEQLAAYPNVVVLDTDIVTISGTCGAFQVKATSETFEARRILLSTGMIDLLPDIEGFRELWGRAIFACPYCHGWEVKDRRWAYLGRAEDAAHFLPFAVLLRGWTSDVTALTNNAFQVPDKTQTQLEFARVRLETNGIVRLIRSGNRLEGIELSAGTILPCDTIFTHSPQSQVELVRALGVALDEDGFVRIDPQTRETSIPGVYAAGDLATRMQSAIYAASSGSVAAGMINLDLTMQLALSSEH